MIFTEEGLLFTDISKTSHRYVEWNAIAYLCSKLTTTSVFK